MMNVKPEMEGITHISNTKHRFESKYLFRGAQTRVEIRGVLHSGLFIKGAHRTQWKNAELCKNNKTST